MESLVIGDKQGLVRTTADAKNPYEDLTIFPR